MGKVIYHGDADGYCSAAIIWNEGPVALCENDLIMMDYHKDFPFDKIAIGEEVWIVDFSLKPDDMQKLLGITTNVVWIDHHKSAIDLYNKSDIDCSSIRGIRSVDASGCELTLGYVQEVYEDGHGVSVDRMHVGSNVDVVSFIGDRDTWTFYYGSRSRAMHEAFIAAGMPLPCDNWWTRLLDDGNEVMKEVELGEKLLSYKKAINKITSDGWAYEAEFEGHTILVCNSNVFTSELFGGRENNYPFVSVYCHDGKQIKVSLYSVNMDVVQYAEKRGGGGHPRACGFHCDKIPFKRKK